MRQIMLFSLLAMALASAPEIWKETRANGLPSTTRALTDLENKWVAALTKADTATLDSIMEEGYVDTDEHSHRSKKQDLFTVLRSGDLKLQSITLSDLQVYDYGDAAVVTGSSAQVGNFKGQPLAANIIFTDTFIRRDGKWKVVSSHRSAI